MTHRRTVSMSATLAVAGVLSASAARADGAGEYPYELLLDGKSVSSLPLVQAPQETGELAALRALDMELFPPGPGQDVQGEVPLGGALTLHDGPAENLLSLLGVPLDPEPPASSPVPLLSDDLHWLEGLVMPDLPVRWDDRVIVYLDRFRADGKWRKIIRSWMRRSERYGPQIRAVMSERGLPEDMQYLAMIESGYNPRAVSWAGAAGLWQFMPATGASYGLVRTKWVDQRKNPDLSTVAAAAYLGRLYERFGSWHLAMAAYNMGPGALMHSIKKYNTNDYWKLAGYEAGLPWGTSNYVPKIIAAAIVGRNREAFGMGDLSYEPTITYDVAIVQVSCKLAHIARAAGVDADEVAALNPELRRNRVPPDMLPYPVRIPDGSGEAFEKGWPQVAAKIDPLDTYEVKFGDTLTRIAHVFGTTVAEVAEVNDIEKKDEIAAGDVILVPHGVVPAELPEEPPTIGVPAVKFVYPGHRRVFYEIIPGDNLSVVGAYFGVTVADLCTWNELDPSAHIHPGMWLQIFVPEDEDLAKAVILEQDEVVIHEVGSEEFLDWQAEQAGKDRIVYTVSEGETLKSIAEKFDVKVSSIVRINQFGYGTDLAPGQDIVLYVDQDSSDNPPQ